MGIFKNQRLFFNFKKTKKSDGLLEFEVKKFLNIYNGLLTEAKPYKFKMFSTDLVGLFQRMNKSNYLMHIRMYHLNKRYMKLDYLNKKHISLSNKYSMFLYENYKKLKANPNGDESVQNSALENLKSKQQDLLKFQTAYLQKNNVKMAHIKESYDTLNGIGVKNILENYKSMEPYIEDLDLENSKVVDLKSQNSREVLLEEIVPKKDEKELVPHHP